MKQMGLQWLHRLAQEPRRLWRRYLINNPKFIWNISLQFLGLRKFPIEV
jgi:N-acetylglucosaminyldiphosphoundecaprenol N-acetyl-beta-D-mannosaminyltransferase